LRRIGKKKMPMYQIVAADSRAARNGKFLEVIGRYEPRQDPMIIATNETRVFHWLKNGALPTDTVRSLFQRNGLWVKWTLTKQGADPAKIASELEKFQAAQALKRVLVPDDVARLVLFLAADDSEGITNQGYVIDGGWV